MNLQEQIGALETGVDQLLRAAAAPTSPTAQAPSADQPAAHHADANGAAHASAEGDVAVETAVETAETTVEIAETADEAPQQPGPALQIARPSQNEITVSLGDKTVSLHPLQVGELIEQLSFARASMQPEPPPNIPQGWRFVSTKNPAMAVQKQSNGDRLLVLRHTGHGWVPFTFTPDMVVQMYMMLTQR